MSRSATVADDRPALGAASAQQLLSAAPIGKFQVVTGLVTVTRDNFVVVRPAVGDIVYEGDLIETGGDGRTAIVFADGTAFQLYADARLEVDEFICGAEKSPDSALLRIVRGAFGLVAGKLATTGRLIIDTPLAQIRSTAPGVGIGSLTLTLLTFGLIRELKADGADPAFLDDGQINYKDLPHGVFEIRTKGDPAHGIAPQIIVVDDPGETIVIRPRGSGVSVQEIANSRTEMVQLQSAYQSTLGTYLQGQIDPFISHWQHADVTPQSTGSTGSSTSLTILGDTENSSNTTPPPTTDIGGTSHTSSGSNNGTNGDAPDVLPPPPPPPPIVMPVATVGVEGPPVIGAPVTGGEGSPIPLELGLTPSNGSTLASVEVGAIPVGAVLSDGTPGHSFTATAGDTSVNVAGWTLSSLTITAPNDTNFTLTVAATDQNATGISAIANGTEAVTVLPMAPTVAPVAVTGVEGSPLALALGIGVNSETGPNGDAPGTNSLYAVTISGIPNGVTLSDSSGALTPSGGSITFDAAQLAGGVLNGLAITSANPTSFSLSVAANEQDAEGNLSATATNTELVTVATSSFSGGTINSNGVYTPQISNGGSTLELTNGSNYEAASWFANNAVSVTTFTASFDYQATGPAGLMADGLAFILQDSSAGQFALGGAGSSLGYGDAVSSGGGTVISPSAAVEFNLYYGHTQGTNFATDGSIGNYNSTGNVAFWNGDEIQVVLTYNGSVLTETLTDLVDGATYSASYAVNLAQLLGSNVAYVGFSASTGAVTSTQAISNFTFEDGVAPAGVAGGPINLALANPSAANGKTVAITVTGVPSDWQLNEGINLGNGTWTVQTDDLNALTVMTAAAYAGAMVLNVTETWTNGEGSTGITSVSDNVEAYTPGSPIFAWSGDDTLTGAGGNDLFVFGQPIGNDTIYNFNAATDQIDLTGFAGITSLGDLAGHIAGNGNGDTVITLGVGETITLHGVDAAALTAADFVFDQTPVLDNAGAMSVSDGAMLPLGGIIDNSGTIALNSIGDTTDLQVVGDGVMLEGAGQVILSDSSDNMIVGTNADAVLTNVDNTISGAGQIGIGDGNLTLVNDDAGTIDANIASGILTLDTGNTIVNAGLLEASHGGTLQIDDNIANSGTLAANGGTLIAAGNVTGAGDVAIGGGGNAEFAGAFDQNVTFTGPGALELEHSQSYGGTVSGFATGDAIDLNDLAYSANETLSWAQGNNDGVLTIDDNGTTDHITLGGDHSPGEFALSQDATAAAGTDVVSVPSVDTTAVPGSPDVAGTISLTVANAIDTVSASVTPDGSSYVGSFSLDTASDSNGNVSVGFDFMANNDQMNLAPGETVTQSYNVAVADAQNPTENANQTVSVTVGGPGNDNFVFAPGVGADTITDFNPQHDTIELDHFANAQTVQELQSLITTDAHGDAVIDLGHSDSITLPGMTAAELHAVLQSAVHLH